MKIEKSSALICGEREESGGHRDTVSSKYGVLVSSRIKKWKDASAKMHRVLDAFDSPPNDVSHLPKTNAETLLILDGFWTLQSIKSPSHSLDQCIARARQRKMSYYDIDAILTDSQKLPCTFQLDVPGLGYLDGNTGGTVSLTCY